MAATVAAPSPSRLFRGGWQATAGTQAPSGLVRPLPGRRAVQARAYFDRPDGVLYVASPFDLMDRQMAEMQRQMYDMQRQMDREFEDVYRQSRAIERQAQQEAQRALQEAQQQVQLQQPQTTIVRRGDGSTVRVEQSESVGRSSYSYYRSIEIRSGPGYYTTPPMAAVTAAPLGLSPLLLVAAAATAVYTVVGAWFAKNFELTTYSEQAKWRLVLLWPFLAAFSPKFRQQFVPAMRGMRAKDAEEGKGPGAGEDGRG